MKIEPCIIQPEKICNDCPDRHATCLICDGPVFRVGCYGDGMICYHCGEKYPDDGIDL